MIEKRKTEFRNGASEPGTCDAFPVQRFLPSAVVKITMDIFIRNY